MKMFLKILLAAYFLLQSAMAHENSNHDTDEDNNQDDYDNDYYNDDDYDDDDDYDNAIYQEDIVPCDSLSTDIPEVQQLILDIHNEYRSNVRPSASNMLKMTWDDELMKSAQKWADKCFFNHSEVKDRNRDGYPYGENILYAPACIKWKKCIKQWYIEKKDFVYGVGPKNNAVTGHYTQLVTDHTHKAGCAFKVCRVSNRNAVSFVCQYFPAGNRPSSLNTPYDQGKWCSQCETACSDDGKLCLNFCPYQDRARNCFEIAQEERCTVHIESCKAACNCKNKIS